MSCPPLGIRTVPAVKRAVPILFFRLGPLVDAYVIDQHALRKHGGGVRITGPVAIHRQVEDRKEGVVEKPFPSRLKVGARAAHVEIAVQVEADGISVPFDSEDVKVSAKRCFAGSL
jgi:hypothetical protein